MKTIKFILSIAIIISSLSCNRENEVIEIKKAIPVFASGLSFQKLIDIPSNYYEDQSVGFLANRSNNSLYLSCRFIDTQPSEIIYKIEANNLSLKTKITASSDFVTKRNYIYNNQLYVFGAQKYTIYDLDLNLNPNSILYLPNDSFSRFGFTAQNESAYIIGGFLGGSAADPNYNRQIFKININSSTTSVFATMPTNRNGGSSEIVNNKIYTFFGYKTNFDPATSNNLQLLNDLLIFDINTANFQMLPLPTNVKVSYTAKYNNLIFVAGNKTAGNFDSPVNGSFFGYFNIDTNIMTEIPITVSNGSYTFPFICEIEIMNNKIYALVKNSASNYSIQVANLQ